MNPAGLHLALNHFPPILDFAALLVLAGGLFRRNPAVIRAALALFVLASLIAIPVFLTGQRSEDIVKDLEGVSSVAIEPHEEAAEWAFGLLCAQGVIALAALLMFRTRPLVRWMIAVIVIVAALTTAAAFRTAYLGGRIHHPEADMNR
jgi:hypothetical protein